MSPRKCALLRVIQMPKSSWEPFSAWRIVRQKRRVPEKHNDQAETAESWVKMGPNKQCTPSQLEQAIGPEVLDTLSKQTGLSRDELLARLCRELPDAVDKYTPQGRLPTEADFSRS